MGGGAAGGDVAGAGGHLRGRGALSGRGESVPDVLAGGGERGGGVRVPVHSAGADSGRRGKGFPARCGMQRNERNEMKAKTKKTEMPTAERKSDAGRLSCKFTKNMTRSIRRAAKLLKLPSGQEFVRGAVAAVLKRLLAKGGAK